MVSLMGSLLSTFMVGSTLIDFMRCLISRIFISYSVFYSIILTVLDFFSSEGSRMCVIDLFLELSSRLLYLSLPGSSFISLAAFSTMVNLFMEEGWSLSG